MGVSMFEGCTDYCGWVAGIIAALSFGSFGVPIKSVKVDVHPLVMQSYKTIVCFLTCWFVLLMGVEVRWTPLGILSGMFWVPGAACGIYGIRAAGLAIAVGTWSSIIVVTSFVWGIIVFQESVKNVANAGMAFIVLTAGLVGMSRYAKREPKLLAQPERSFRRSRTLDDDASAGSSDGSEGDNHRFSKRKNVEQALAPVSGKRLPLSIEHEPLILEQGRSRSRTESENVAKIGLEKDRYIFFGGRLVLSQRQCGIVGAVINGAWGGLNLVPLHYAKLEGYDGADYLISYAVGSLIVNIIIWVLFFGYYLYQTKGSINEAFNCLPKWHLNRLWRPGLLAGTLYSLGNLCSILAVTYLGQGIGYSMCQSSLLVSGLWGIFYYKEIDGRETIMKWFASAVCALTGILWLSYEHGATAHR